jgi:ribonuclease HII
VWAIRLQCWKGKKLAKQSVIVGVDEAGRGPLAGNVVAAAVILDPEQVIEGLTDSKKLSEKKRAQLFDEITAKAAAYGIARASVEEIDQLNILQASLLAMQRAVAMLELPWDAVWVDGNQCPQVAGEVQAIVKGDLTVPAIGAASILAKVTRDREMLALEEVYPGYGFAKHKGYPTKAHREALLALGASPVHRRSYAPVKKVLAAREEMMHV